MLVAVLAAAWGQGRESTLGSRASARAPTRLEPAHAAAWSLPMVLRTTSHAAPAAGGRWRAAAAVVAVAGNADGPARGDGLWLTGAGEAPAPGTLLAARVRVQVPQAAALPGGFDLRRFLAGRSLQWSARIEAAAASPLPLDAAGSLSAWFARLRSALSRRCGDLLPPREARLARAVLLGERSAESRREASAFTDLGLAHLFAVSGLHVGILAGLMLMPLHAVGVGRTARAWLLALALPVYAALVGAPGSVLRAGTMVGLAAAAAAAGRRPGALRLLGLVVWAGAAWDPDMTADAGFRLSCLAAAGIVSAMRSVEPLLVRLPRLVRPLAGGFAVSLAAQWATLPVVASSFGSLNPWSPLANVVAVPLFGAAVWLTAAALAVGAVAPALGAALAVWPWLLLRGLAASAAAAAATVRQAAIPLPPPAPPAIAAWLLASTLLLLLPRTRGPMVVRLGAAAAALALVAAMFGPAGRALPPRGAPVVVQFAVGQGDGAVVAFPDGWTAAIDLGDAAPGRAGTWERDVAPWLERQGVRRLDAVLLTHGHRDHTGGARAQALAAPPRLWAAGGRAAAAVPDSTTPWLAPAPGPIVLHRWRNWHLEVIDPGHLLPGAGENDRSLAAVLWQENVARMVWTGDLEARGERALLAAGLVPAGCDVWKAGHHGSATSGSGAFLDRLAPGLVVISCGVDNRHAHPSHGPFTASGQARPVRRTDLDGALSICWNNGIPEVRSLVRGAP